MNNTEDTHEQQGPDLKTTCPFCLSEIDVHLDVKGRPYWRCWRCEVRSFGTKTAFSSLKADGWIWSDERPLEALKAWLKEVMQKIGLVEEQDG
jgi:hypothetical protein